MNFSPTCNRCAERPGVKRIRDICPECDDVLVCLVCFDMHLKEIFEGLGREFPAPREVNWGLIKTLHDRPHPLIRDIDMSNLHYGIQEVLLDTKAVHHLLDMAGVPQGYGLDTRDIASRTLIAIIAMGNLRERLDRITTIHNRETGPAGMVGSFCAECGDKWECITYRIAKGILKDTDG